MPDTFSMRTGTTQLHHGLNRLIHSGYLRRILTVYLHYFNAARPHRTLAQLTPAQAETTHPQAINLANFQIRRKTILDGLTNEYQLAA